MKNLIWLLLFTFTNVSCALAQEKVVFDASNLKDKDLQAYQVLLKAELFRLGGIDYFAETSNEEASLRILLKYKKSVEAFEHLVNSASPEGKLYGLLGLRVKNKVAYQQALLRLKSGEEPPEGKSFWGVRSLVKTENNLVLENPNVGVVPKGEVVTQSGCVVSRKTWDEILGSIETGEYDKYFKKR